VVVLEADDVGRGLLAVVGHGLDALVDLVDDELVDDAQLLVHVRLDRLPALLRLLHQLLEVEHVPEQADLLAPVHLTLAHAFRQVLDELVALELGGAQQRDERLVHELRVVVADEDAEEQVRVEEEDHHGLGLGDALHHQLHLVLDLVGEDLAQDEPTGVHKPSEGCKGGIVKVFTDLVKIQIWRRYSSYLYRKSIDIICFYCNFS